MSELALYAAREDNSLGRVHPEEAPSERSQFQRDRDRIIHSTAFRRLEYKTQVFVNHEGDLFRTRLTHSIEVAQIARSIARALRVNEDLVEAISLSHDLGHTPFGHAGQDALNECMREHGGFEHNLQSLRTVDLLEERYGAFDGLNLTFETREGILIERTQPTIEAQICNLADEIAYNTHDVDDGLRSGLITLEQLEEVPVFARYRREVLERYPQITGRRLIHETIRRMINAQVVDLVAETRSRIAAAAPNSIEDVRGGPELVAYSDAMRAEQRALKQFLRDELYRHYQVLRMTAKARRIVAELFGAFHGDPKLLPPQYQSMAKDDRARAIADYIAGMTDRYAMREHRRLFAVGDI